MLQEKISQYIKSRESATARIKTLLRQPVNIQLRQDFSPHKTIHQFQSQQKSRFGSLLRIKRNFTRHSSPSIKFDEVITNKSKRNNIQSNEKQKSAPLLKQRVHDVNIQTQMPTLRASSQWFGSKNTKNSQFAFVTLSTLFDDDIIYHKNKNRVPKFDRMEHKLNANQFLIYDCQLN